MTRDEPSPQIEAVTIKSRTGMEVTILNLGATIQSIKVPTESGLVNAVLGYSDYRDYWNDTFFLGATVGRFANRIFDARFPLNGRQVSLDPNEESTGHCLHGGNDGFHKRIWQVSRQADDRIECKYLSPDGECGFPGNLEVSVIYQLVSDFALSISYRATSDADTVINLANHAYFNLDQQRHTINTHLLQINSDRYTPVDQRRIPTGEIKDVAATDFDFREPTNFADTGSERSNGREYDHNFELRNGAERLRHVATLMAPQSGLSLELKTTQPGLQLYTGDQLNEPFHPREGLCLEAQGFPDSPNQAGFPSAFLAAGEPYRERTIYNFLPGKPYS